MRFVLLLILSAFFLPVFSQREEKVEADYTFVYPSSMSLKDAKQEAQSRARIEAIKKVFPETIEANTGSLSESNIINGNGAKSYSKFVMTGISEVRGEWIYDIEKPVYEEHPSEGDLCSISCHVKGLVRDVSWNKPEFSWQLMRNHKDERNITCEFQNNDELIMTFEAPCDGYLAVFQCDEEGRAFSLIPNETDANGIYKVKGQKKYVFFKEGYKNGDEQIDPDPILMMAVDKIDYNQFYVFFSPNLFHKPVNTSKGECVWIRGHSYDLPAYVDDKNFQKWQLKLLSRDKDLQREKRIVSIRANR